MKIDINVSEYYWLTLFLNSDSILPSNIHEESMVSRAGDGSWRWELAMGSPGDQINI